jgi:hypothetical protein
MVRGDTLREFLNEILKVDIFWKQITQTLDWGPLTETS